MVSRTNVNDPEWLNDHGRLNDYLQDLTAEETAIRDTMVDIYGITNAYIFSGLTVEDGAGADTFLVNAGRCRDYLKYHIVLAANVDNIPCASNAGAVWNYIAVRHIWTYANPDAAVKSGIAYNRQRSDAYEIDVALAAHNEALGWVRLARAQKVGAVWEYDMEFTEGVANYGRSRTAELESWSIDFSFVGIPGAGTLMNRHDILGGAPGAPTGDLWRVPFDFRVCRIEVDARIVGGADMSVDPWQNGAFHPRWGAGAELILTAGLLNAIWYSPEGMASAGALQYYKDDLIQVELASAGFPTDIVVLISGRKTGTV